MGGLPTPTESEDEDLVQRINSRVAAGLPVPRHDLVLDIDGEVLMVQELLPGRPPTQVTPMVIDTIVDLNDRFATLLDNWLDVPILPLCLDRSGDSYPSHEVLASHS